jgi:hypothetical protein
MQDLAMAGQKRDRRNKANGKPWQRLALRRNSLPCRLFFCLHRKKVRGTGRVDAASGGHPRDGVASGGTLINRTFAARPLTVALVSAYRH